MMQLDRRIVICGGTAFAGALAWPKSARPQRAAPIPAGSASRTFEVRYKGDPIGSHVVKGSENGAEVHAVTNIHLLVKAAFITLYSFDHQSEEVWRDGRLVSLRSETRDEGQTFRITGAATADGFRLDGSGGPFIAPPGLLTSNSMWYAAIVAQEKLIDAQHGGVVGVSTRKLRDEPRTVLQRPVMTSRYTFITPHCAGDIWYDEARNWVGAEFERQGAHIEYRLSA